MTIKVDLLPTERKRFTFDPMMGFLLVIIILCTVGFVLFGSKLQSDIEASKKEVAKIEEEIKQIEQNLPVIEDLKSQIAKLESEIKVIEGLKYDPLRYARLLAEVGKVLPENVWLSTLAIEPGTQSVTMNGMAAAIEGRQPLATIAALMGNLDQSAYFSDASLSSTSQTTVPGSSMTGFTFQIESHYDPEYAALGDRGRQGGGSAAPAPAPAAPAPEAAPAPAGSPAASPATDASPAGEASPAEASPAGEASPAEGGAPPSPAESPTGT